MLVFDDQPPRSCVRTGNTTRGRPPTTPGRDSPPRQCGTERFNPPFPLWIQPNRAAGPTLTAVMIPTLVGTLSGTFYIQYIICSLKESSSLLLLLLPLQQIKTLRCFCAILVLISVVWSSLDTTLELCADFPLLLVHMVPSLSIDRKLMHNALTQYILASSF